MRWKGHGIRCMTWMRRNENKYRTNERGNWRTRPRVLQTAIPLGIRAGARPIPLSLVKFQRRCYFVLRVLSSPSPSFFGAPLFTTFQPRSKRRRLFLLQNIRTYNKRKSFSIRIQEPQKIYRGLYLQTWRRCRTRLMWRYRLFKICTMST